MRNGTKIREGLRPLWVLLVVASATAMSLYLLDPYSPPLSRWVCCVLTVATWATVARVWYRCLRLNRRVRPGVLLLLATLILALVSTLQLSVFRCAPPATMQQYLALKAAIDDNDLVAAQAILAHGRNPDYVPPQKAGCYGVGECDDKDRVLDDAITIGKPEMVEMLLKYGAKANDADGNSSALLYTIYNMSWQGADSSQNAVAAVLLKYGANPNSVKLEQCRKWSALQLARRQDDIPLAKMLKKAGAREHADFPQEPNCVWATE